MKKILPILVVGILVLSGLGAVAVTNIENNPPDKPKITGPAMIHTPGPHEYTFKAIDPDGDDVSYQIDWRDGDISDWTDFYESGEEIIRNHIFSEQGVFQIKARAKDIHGAIGEWSELQLSVSQSSQQSSSIPSSQNTVNVIPSTGSMVFNNDTTPPEIEVTWEAFKDGGTWYVDFICEAYDEESGIDRVEMYINDGFHGFKDSGPTYEFVVEWSKAFKTSVFKFVAYNGAGLSAFVIINGSDIKSYSCSQSSSQQSQVGSSGQSTMCVFPSTGKTDVATSRTTFNDGTLSGYVNDTDMNPIEGALVRVYFHETYEEDYTDSSGYYHVTNIPICYCMKNCTASKDGYETKQVSLAIDENTTYDFVLNILDPCYPVLNGTMGLNGWWISPVTVSFIFDPEEVAEIWYNYKGLHLYIEPFIVDENDTIDIYFYWINHEGEQSSYASISLDIDQTPPDIEEVTWESFQEPPIYGLWYVTFTCDAVDEPSGMDRVEMFINDGEHEIITGAGPIYEFVIEWMGHFSDWVFTFVHYDTAGNFAKDSINESEINDSEIMPFPYIKNNHFTFNGWLERFPILQKILEVLRLNI